MSLAKRLSLIVILPLLGAGLAFLLTFAVLEGWVVIWQSLGRPPENAVSIASTNNGLWVTTASGQVYAYDNADWRPDNPPAVDAPLPLDYVSADYCQAPLAPLGAVEVQMVCRTWGPGMRRTGYALRADGSVLTFEQRLGEYDFLNLIFSPCVGAVLGIVGAALVLMFATERRAATS